METNTPRPDWELSLDELADRLRLHVDAGRKITFLIGAGISKSAGIPTAAEIVEDIDKKYGSLVGGCERTYSAFMSKLVPMQQRNLLMDYVAAARLNAAHLYLAALVNKDIVEHILTVNFDPLMVNALVYSNLPPYVYDIANLVAFAPKLMATPSIVHLHGQLGALINLHSAEQVAKVKSRVHDVLQDTLCSGPLVVVGYSGENDPVFDVLCDYPGHKREESAEFPYGLFWIGYGEGDPPDHVHSGLLMNRSRYAHFIRSPDADSFFMKLAGRLKAESPILIDRPFSFLKNVLAKVAEVEAKEQKTNLTKDAQRRVEDAIECFEKNRPCKRAGIADKVKREVEQQAKLFWLEGRTNEKELNILLAQAKESCSSLAQTYLVYALNNWAAALIDSGRKLEDDKAKKAFRAASQKCSFAAEIMPTRPEPFNNWGNALNQLGLVLEKKKAITTFREACKKYDIATRIKPVYNQAFNNWGIVLANLGRRLDNVEAVPVFKEACQKFKKATEINPARVDAFLNWGVTLGEIGCRIDGSAAVEAFRKGCEVLRQATKIKPKYAEAFNSWGSLLIYLYYLAPEEQKAEILAEAREKLTEAHKITPGFSDYNLACISAIEGNKIEALRLLESALKAKLVPAETAVADKDFKAYWDDPDFTNLIMKYRGK